ncbi:MAG TPA: hypothetical protein VEB86_19350 [Chryseosolibacter sp.]|nr:hypothetical protein [Chryseosolibacter sp.]
MIGKVIRYISHWEDWHWFAKYILIAPAWLWNCLKARSFWFFTSSNPTIVFGGFTGETKQEIYKQLPPSSYPKSIYITPSTSFPEVESLVASNNLTLPLAVKPDVGMMGLMFRKIESIDHLRQYHAVMPVGYIIQEFIRYPLEVSVFYYRFPNESNGHITGFLKKEAMAVIGDGEHTLRELIMNYPRAQFRLTEMFSKHASKLEMVIPAGEHFQLSEALNLSRGGRLVNLEHEKDDRLLKIFDDLSHYAGNLYYGRYDIRCSSIEDLKSGRNFSILEYNGSGAEPHHVYGNGNSLFKACRILIEHWNILYRISDYNHRQGIPYWSFSEGLEFTRKARNHFKKLRELDSSFEFRVPAIPLEPATACDANRGYVYASNS